MAPKLTRRKHLDLEDELLSWYEENYPDQTITWILNILLREFKNGHGETPKQVAHYAALNAIDIAEESKNAGQ